VAIEAKLNALTSDINAMKRLLGYDWILEQCGVVVDWSTGQNRHKGFLCLRSISVAVSPRLH